MVQTHCISSVAFNPVSSINWTAITMKATLRYLHVVEEPPKSGLAVKRQVSGSEYVEKGKTKQIQSLSEQSSNSYLNV